eukprot:9398104-Lingulodinium_polyedra.AAC.1
MPWARSCGSFWTSARGVRGLFCASWVRHRDRGEFGAVWRAAGVRTAVQMMHLIRGRAGEIDAWPAAARADLG